MTEAMQANRWQFWIDRGGTFTDIVGRRPDGSIVTHKLLSESPERYRDAAVAGIRELLGRAPGEPVTGADVECVKMGTTVATNALLERKGDPTLLVITRGFGDALRIGCQERPDLFARRIVLPELLYDRVLEANERVGADGQVVVPVDQEGLRDGLVEARAAGLASVAIVFVHGYRYPEHERVAAAIAREVGFHQISVSHEASPLMKLVGRGDTTVVDAYLSPILRRYVDQVAEELPGVDIYFMQSSGGLTSARAFRGKDAILSGPAGGIVGMVGTATLAGVSRVIGFDMGGTSTDVSHYAGEFERAFETQVAGVRMRAPMMSIHTVAAGGGSMLHFDGARMRVGPDSAGANPGPLCYRRGGPLTLTDANVLLGKLQPDHFPKVFGKSGREPLDGELVRERFAGLAVEIERRTGVPQTPERVAEGFVDIAVMNMANAIKRISVARGYDVTRYTLQCFGGAGGQHACRVADALGMTRVLIHPLAGVLSAYGMGLSDQRVMCEAAVELPLSHGTMAGLEQRLSQLSAEGHAELDRQKAPRDRRLSERRIHIRYEGTDTSLLIPAEPTSDSIAGEQALREAFEDAYRRRFSFLMPGRALMVEAVSVEAVAAGRVPDEPTTPIDDRVALAADTHVVIWSGGERWLAGLVDRERMRPGHVLPGPAFIAERNATTVVEPGWRAVVTERNHVLLERVSAAASREPHGTDVDPVRLEVFNNLYMSIAEQMGGQLQNTAYSVNIKERLDFSCAVFDASGDLVANAPHMPVHLGSMGESIKAVKSKYAGRMCPGDVFALNDPFHGGTHLPDVTVVTPVFDDRGQRLLFYVASRGHHADIGGTTPGSMPPGSVCAEEEGVKLDTIKLVERGKLLEEEVLALLRGGPFPARNPSQNIADLKAQVAANEKGVQELRRMVSEFGLDVVEAYMGHVQANAEESVRRAISRLSDGAFTLELDNGARIAVALRVDRLGRNAVIDFTGTSEQLDSNFNAPRAVCTAAVLYVFRTLIDDDIPLNAGCLVPLEIIVPERSMLDPHPPAAVVAGNVETSMCITNALYGALGVLASSQCTMNNLTFGNARYQYYETIAGGAGAGPDFDGQSVVQTHMTNSRLTDPEVLEFRFPVRLESFGIRRGSGGAGLHRGGDGAIRRIRFLEPMTVAILSNGRRVPSFGLAGGLPGALGRNRVLRAGGQEEVLDHIAACEVKGGDAIEIHTPGGGGFGRSRRGACPSS